MTFKILTFDGGGIRGLLSAKLLSLLEKSSPFLHKVDLFAGTSTGSIIASALALGKPVEDIVTLYSKFGNEVFVKRKYSFFKEKSKYQREPLKKLLSRHLIDDTMTLSKLKKKLLITAFELKNKEKNRWSPRTFHNLFPLNEDTPIIDLILRSAAAPIYFSSYQGYIDGGVAMNNPSLIALTSALHAKRCDLKTATLLSFGTGFNPFFIDKNIDWGALNWVMRPLFAPRSTPSHPIFGLLWDGILEVADMQCQELLKTRYHRVNIPLEKPIEMDDVGATKSLLKVAENVPKTHPKMWDEMISWIKEHF